METFTLSAVFFLNYVDATSEFHWKVKTSIATLTFSTSSEHRNDS